jgi:hypothetical protein
MFANNAQYSHLSAACSAKLGILCVFYSYSPNHDIVVIVAHNHSNHHVLAVAVARANTPPQDHELVALLKLNQSDNWETNVTPAPGGSFRVKVTPPREVDIGGRIDVVLTYKRLSTLHKISHLQFPAPSGSDPQYIRPFATFPKPKILGLGAKTDKVRA